jgi:hypothetical protein
MRLRIGVRVGSHFLQNFCANADSYSDGNAKPHCDADGKSQRDGVPEADTRNVCIV